MTPSAPGRLSDAHRATNQTLSHSPLRLTRRVIEHGCARIETDSYGLSHFLYSARTLNHGAFWLTQCVIEHGYARIETDSYGLSHFLCSTGGQKSCALMRLSSRDNSQMRKPHRRDPGNLSIARETAEERPPVTVTDSGER